MSRKRNSTDSSARRQGAGPLGTRHPHHRSPAEVLSVALGMIIALSRDLLETCDRLDANVAAEKREWANEVVDMAIKTLEATITTTPRTRGASEPGRGRPTQAPN